MPPRPPSLTDALRVLPPAPLCVGYSGGLDSTVLLHALAASQPARERGLRAWHVHHGLHDQADAWARHCEATCTGLDVPLTVTRVPVETAGEGIEAAARRARHATLAHGLGDGEVLVFAHHRDDQAETFLLRALRASGPDGLASMKAWRRFGPGHLWRPLLPLPRTALAAYAERHRLRWIDDPGNADTAFDRNFLRQRVLPLLRERWPHAGAALAGSAGLCAEAATLLRVEDARALALVGTGDPQSLSRERLRGLPPARRARVLRHWIGTLGLPALPASGVARIEADLLDARADAEPTFRWHGAVVRAWRDLLHAELQRPPLPPDWQAPWDGCAPLRLPSGDSLHLHAAPPRPADATPGFGRGVIVHARRGGERITLPGRRHSHALKHVLQDLGVPPWRRARLPLLSSPDGELLAAGDLVLGGAFAAWLGERGLQLAWHSATLPGDD